MPEVYLTKMQARSARVKKALKVRILDQNTDQKCLAKKAGMKYGTLNKRVNEPETCSLDELWRILDALEMPEEERMKLLL